jgi:hypothetical protein
MSGKNPNFKTISSQASDELVKSFHLKKVKKAVLEYDNFKSLGIGSINFDFLNWTYVNTNFMRFMGEFHGNCKLVKQSNCTFVALIPKVVAP